MELVEDTTAKDFWVESGEIENNIICFSLQAI